MIHRLDRVAAVPLEHPRAQIPGSLRADCANCFALCCTVPAFVASSDFAITKSAGQPCPNLEDDFRCGIHTRLRATGFTGCTVYDCFGAGQKVSQETCAGRDWRSEPGTARTMVEVFPVMRALHELLYYLAEARSRTAPGPRQRELHDLLAETEQLTGGTPKALTSLDVDAHRDRVNAHLLRVSEAVRAGLGGRNHRGADLIAAKLKGADLRGANLRGALMIGADLRGADLRSADLIGADLRGADLRGADLTDSIFLLQSQLESAKGDRQTRFSPPLVRPTGW